MTPTYNTGKVQIGLLYTRPMPIIQADALLLQTALLESRTASPRRAWLRLLGKIWAWM